MSFLVVFLTVSFANIFLGQLVEDDFCFHEKHNKTGICTKISKCPKAINVIKQGIHPQHCGFDGLQSIVCCLEPEKKVVQSRSLGQISKEKCKEYSQYIWSKELNPTLLIGADDIVRHECPFNREKLIVGGRKATRREFPHMVHIGYDLGDNATAWACGGTLISDQYVLTAAHCLDNIKLQIPKFARMGITNQADDEHIQIFDIAERIPYPEYSPLYHDYDIALVKLNKKAQLNTWVRPACLNNNSALPNSNVIATGWGDVFSGGEKSDVLLKVVLELYSVKHCNKYYEKNRKLLSGVNNNTMICAGSSQGDKDTCQGDSGGPLQIYNDNQNTSCLYDIVGITSYGVECAIAPNVPSVYTRVSYFIKWIEDVVWPPNKIVKNDIGNKCELKNGENGVCRLIADCPEAIALIRKGMFPKNCGFEGAQVSVCCSETVPTIPLKPSKMGQSDTNPKTRLPGETARQKCLEYSKYAWSVEMTQLLLSAAGEETIIKNCPFGGQELIIGGYHAVNKEFPHMVQLGYDSDKGPQWLCVGSLISDQYVLTGAHCLYSRALGNVKYARMGLVNLQETEHMQEFTIIESTPYSQYKPPSYYHDIALVKLDRKVELNNFVRPACINTNSSGLWSKLITSGWGDLHFGGEQDNIMQKLILNFYNHSMCNSFYKSINNKKLIKGIDDETMICAGNVDALKDVGCQQNSDGPLQVYTNIAGNHTCTYDIVGVTSFGKICSATDVHTRVSYYTKWIEDIVWP